MRLPLLVALLCCLVIQFGISDAGSMSSEDLWAMQRICDLIQRYDGSNLTYWNCADIENACTSFAGVLCTDTIYSMYRFFMDGARLPASLFSSLVSLPKSDW